MDIREVVEARDSTSRVLDGLMECIVAVATDEAVIAIEDFIGVTDMVVSGYYHVIDEWNRKVGNAYPEMKFKASLWDFNHHMLRILDKED